MTRLCESVTDAANLLRSGRLVAIPTETVYGLAAVATNSEAVAGIFEAKQRPSFDPLICHVADLNSAERFGEFSAVARQLAAAFWPGPLTLVVRKSDQISDLVTSGLPNVGLRIPNHTLTLELLREIDLPIAAPSANPFGRTSPTTAQHVLDGLSGRIDGVLDGGPCHVGVESTVLSLVGESPMILRPGGTTREAIEAVIGPVEVAQPDSSTDDAAQPAPGMLSRHYAPKTRLIISNEKSPRPIPDASCGLLTYGHESATGFDRIECLTPDDDLTVCAANFFAGLRSLDAAKLDVIIAKEFPGIGLGVALNDRLRRAACGSES